MIQLTVGKLKEALEDYPNDTLIYMESSNVYIKGIKATQFSQIAESTHPCKAHYTGEKALMIVGSIR